MSELKKFDPFLDWYSKAHGGIDPRDANITQLYDCKSGWEAALVLAAKEIDGWRSAQSELLKTVDRLNVKLTAAQEALLFYASCQVAAKATVWEENGQPSYGIRVIHDNGKKAKDALALDGDA